MKRFYAISFFILLGSSAALAEDANKFLLAIPLSTGDHRSTELCSTMASSKGTECGVWPLASGASEQMTVISDIDEWNALRERWSADIAFPELPPDDGIDVQVNPCWRMFCAPGSICVWGGQFTEGAQCVSADDSVVPPRTFWPQLPSPQLFKLNQVSDDRKKEALANEPYKGEWATDPITKRDFDINCGVPLSPGYECKGTWIESPKGEILLVP